MKTRNCLPRFCGLMWLPSLIVAPLLSCSSEPPALSVGTVEFTETELLPFNPSRRTRLAELTAFGLAVSRGETAELGEPLVRRRMREAVLENLERELTVRLAGVDEAGLEARYSGSPQFELTVRHLVVLVEEWASEDDQNETRASAESALERIQAGEDFAQVAGEVSEEPGAAERGGLLQPGRRGQWVEEFWAAASRLDVGEVSPVVRTEYGFHVLKLESQTVIPFPEARFRVVEAAAQDLPPNDEGILQWIDSVAAPLVLDSAMLQTAWEEVGSLLPLTEGELIGHTPDAQVAIWPGGSYSAEELRWFLLTMERPTWDHVNQGGLQEFLLVAEDGARRAMLEATAVLEGVQLPPGAESFFSREWETAVVTWAQALGFREGMNAEGVKALALEGVGSSGQSAGLARGALRNRAPLLLTAYQIGPRS